MMANPSEGDQTDGTLTQAAADQLVDAFVQSLLAVVDGDLDGKDAEVAKMRHILRNPKSTT
ncbi:hypothetical protein ABZ912_20075 [Nonomuraea angiospora]|uniref:hypothetical protein n=1 Tax=Nonomuraea angiospora TaxID=46172 RepID=UPI0034098F6B